MPVGDLSIYDCFATYNNRPGGLCNGASWRSNLGFLHELYYIKIKVVSAYGQNIYRRCVALRAGRDKCTHLRTAKGDFVTSPRAIYTIQSLACVSLSKFYNVLSRVEPGAAQSIFYSVHCVGLLCVHVTALTGHQYMWWLVTLLPQQESPETQQVSFAAATTHPFHHFSCVSPLWGRRTSPPYCRACSSQPPTSVLILFMTVCSFSGWFSSMGVVIYI